jgi:hypothetical protein
LSLLLLLQHLCFWVLMSRNCNEIQFKSHSKERASELITKAHE